MSFYSLAVKVVNGVLRVFLFYRVKGRENIPVQGAFLLCSNHRAYKDPVLLAAGCPRKLTFMAKDTLFKKPFLGWLIKSLGAFPIKRGRGDASAVMATLKIMKQGGATVIFPEGTRIKDGTRKQISSGIIRLAMQSKAPIVPAFLTNNSVTYGKPISYKEYNEQAQNAELMQKLADELMNTIYSLGADK